MKKINLLLVVLVMTMFSACNKVEENPFFTTYNTPHGTFPFDKLKTEHYMPALEKAIELHNAEIEAIINNEEAPTFENTIVALERSGRMYSHVLTVFYALLSAETDDAMQQLSEQMAPILNEHDNSIRLNAALFERIKAVYDAREELDLDLEDARLLDVTYRAFAENGAALSDEDKAKYSQLTEQLSLAQLAFQNNALKELNEWSLLITDKEELSGLPENVVEEAAENAKAAEQEGYLLNLRTTCYTPIMLYADNRDLREKVWRAFNTQCQKGSKYDNTEYMRTIINTRLEIARLFGYNDYANYYLHDCMAKNEQNVFNMLNQLLEAYTPAAKEELARVKEYAATLGADFELMPWDMSYYSEKYRVEKYNISDEMLKPYFELESVKKGVFGLATRLYGLHFTKNNDIPVYHKEVEAFDVTDEDGNFVAVLYTDFHPRAGKRAGAWMTEFKGQWREADGSDSRPHITIVMNFTRPVGKTPALLTSDEVETFLHEFGHALHGMLSACRYESISGTNVYRDFVELPSQFNENFLTEKEFLDTWAKHYQTGESIPNELIEKMVAAANYNAGTYCLRQLGFGLQDMAFHSITEPYQGDICQIEREATKPTNLLPVVENTGRCTTFSHIFSGGYAAGYYSYKWSEMLDADAFALFKEKGVFNPEVAKSFKENILMRGNTEDPTILYSRFRGQEPTIDALLKRDGIK